MDVSLALVQFFKQLGKNEKQVQVVTLSKILVYNRKVGS